MSDAIDAKPARKGQIRPPVEAAIKQIVTTGCTIAVAAETQGMKPRSLAIALRKSHVAARLADEKRAWLESRTFRAWVGMAELADSAISEEVRHKSLKVFLEAAGELGGKSDAPAPVGTAIQIIVGSGPDRREVRISDGSKTGVIEAEAWEPETAEAAGDDD